MKTITTSNWKTLLCTLLLCITALWAMPANASVQPLYIGLSNNNIGEYDAATGAVINFSLISKGLNGPYGLALSGNNLFVANYDSGTIGKYNATTGAAINANFITGLYYPDALALSGNNLFVADEYSGTVGKYNATTGTLINANFLPEGLSFPISFALSGNNLFVGNWGSNKVGEYNATTGTLTNADFITRVSPDALALSGNNLFVADEYNGTVGKYNATTGAAINANFITGLSEHPISLAWSGNNLFVGNLGNYYRVSKYNATTGAVINANFITALGGAWLFALVVSAPPSLPSCTLQDALAYQPTSSSLIMKFTIGNTIYFNATWDAWLTYQDIMQHLFSVPQRITNPPQVITKTRTGLSREGQVGVLSTLTTPTGGIVCSSWVQTNTGRP